MRREVFPDPNVYDFPEWVEIGEYLYHAEGVVAFGTPLTVENLREAYSKGIFPWYTPGLPLPWHSPDPRAILVFDELTIPRSLAKAKRHSDLSFTIDRDFSAVIKACSESERPDQPGTWITPEFIEAYTALHKAGDAHSVEPGTPPATSSADSTASMQAACSAANLCSTASRMPQNSPFYSSSRPYAPAAPPGSTSR
ncbi:MAG: leucyl/phenylalanyl-tRNA--protein transferase [Acidobacteria bacterium OLB17]|nr:MAG: leucyl/phenylalanyl-tRNA--protein transferase [Acidobacteria bacterium OLB17]